jgi:hypothetical protein
MKGDTTMTTRIPDGTDVCFYGDIQAKIGGYNGIDHLIVDRDDGGVDIWSSNFTVGLCGSDTPNDTPDDDEHIDDDPTDDEPTYEDIPTDEEYPPKSQVATDLSSIFGDIKPIYIIAAIIALILLG